MKLYDEFGREVADMELFQDILARILQGSGLHLTISGLSGDIPDLVELRCFQTIRRIRAILDDPALSDEGCFAQVEEIVLAMEELGVGGGCRHDFG